MEEITIPYHVAVPAIICSIGLGIIIFFRKKLLYKDTLLCISVIVFFILYLIVVGRATFDAIYYQWDLNRYDLNKDGMFSGLELTDKQQEAMSRLINDAGRNLSFITGFVFALIISTAFYILGRVIIKLRERPSGL